MCESNLDLEESAESYLYLNDVISKEIKEFRKQNNLSIDELAKKINKSVGWISNIENCKTKKISFTTLKSLLNNISSDGAEIEKVCIKLQDFNVYKNESKAVFLLKKIYELKRILSIVVTDDLDVKLAENITTNINNSIKLLTTELLNQI